MRKQLCKFKLLGLGCWKELGMDSVHVSHPMLQMEYRGKMPTDWLFSFWTDQFVFRLTSSLCVEGLELN